MEDIIRSNFELEVVKNDEFVVWQQNNHKRMAKLDIVISMIDNPTTAWEDTISLWKQEDKLPQ